MLRYDYNIDKSNSSITCDMLMLDTECVDTATTTTTTTTTITTTILIIITATIQLTKIII
jgi:hypothetical protein